MSKILLNSLLIGPAALGAVLMVSSASLAADASAKTDLAASQITVDAPTTTVNSVSSLALPVQIAATPVAAPEAAAPVAPVAAPAEVAGLPNTAPVSSTADSLAQVSQYSNEGDTAAGQVTSVSQLSDVQPTDWAFQALQSLVERYGCIAGYPDGTYRGQRAMTRFEFAAGLNACMDRVNELIASATADLVRKEDLLAIQKLQEEFAAELATLRGRVDALEARTTQLEAQQFSTTTKLQGEVIFALSAANDSNEAVFQNRVRLALNSSFTGKDLLITRLSSANAPLFNFDGNAPIGAGVTTNTSGEGRQTFQLNTSNDVIVDWLAYYFPVTSKAQVYVAAVGGLHSDYVITTANPYNEDFGGGSGALTFFGQDNAIYNIGGGSGIGFTYKFNDVIGFNLGYLAGDDTSSAATPLNSNGLFNGGYGALAQLSFQPLKGKLKVAATYVNAYATAGSSIFNYGGTGDAVGVVGTQLANFPGLGSAVTTNSGGLSVSYQFTPKFVVSAWGSYTSADPTGGGSAGLDQGEIWSYAMAFAFPDAFMKGNLAGLIVGAEPYLGNAQQVAGPAATNNVPIHIEGYYKFQINNYISVTPGVIYIVNQGQSDANDAVIGTIRTTFKF
ncbi:hypothetical protein DO97_08960 [Neosynechococcus sphagnicola sy1]|uniref:SLH domain-containing protein n=1 Tax=Neosynechococcus sphagnicola sy1 TaxID=1497020 RepID=A0A098TJQ4_9CYAN|nr:iron uptake porin [Neosynechococcus sphagnicola]KGF72476.1 hypothetical protein DO97_08960 [Neosynechococcus sphagnicola sy1]